MSLSRGFVRGKYVIISDGKVFGERHKFDLLNFDDGLFVYGTSPGNDFQA